MTDNDGRSVTVEREIPHPPEKIWRALTTQHLIEEWLMKIDFGLDLGHRFQLRGDWGHVDCEILDVEPGRTLSYAWNTAHDDPAYALDSVVTFTLEPTPAGTLLRMEQVGFRPDQKIGRAHVRTPVTNAHIVCRLLLKKK